MLRVGAIVIVSSAFACAHESPQQEQQRLDAKVASLVPRIEEAVGLTFKRAPVVELRSPAEVRDFVAAEQRDSLAKRDLDGWSGILGELGMIPRSLDLPALLLRVLEEQVAGYYDPKTKVLYVVRGTSDDMRDATVTHELVHALQDQYLNLDSLEHAHGSDDRLTAAQAAVEGHATFIQLRLMRGGAAPDETEGAWVRTRELIRTQQSGMPVFASAPFAIQEMLVFPYLSGAEFIRKTADQRAAGQSPLDILPASTEQVVHPGSFLPIRDDPTTVALPAPEGARVLYEDTMGEFATRLFLFQHTQDQEIAYRGAEGWDGDRIMLVETPAGRGVAWVSVWDRPEEATEFYEALKRVVDGRFGPTGGTRVTLPGGFTGIEYSVAGRGIRIVSGEVAERPVVCYEDMPAGVSARVIDPTTIRLTGR
jgi:hypothetical protein